MGTASYYRRVARQSGRDVSRGRLVKSCLRGLLCGNDDVLYWFLQSSPLAHPVVRAGVMVFANFRPRLEGYSLLLYKGACFLGQACVISSHHRFCVLWAGWRNTHHGRREFYNDVPCMYSYGSSLLTTTTIYCATWTHHCAGAYAPSVPCVCSCQRMAEYGLFLPFYSPPFIVCVDAIPCQARVYTFVCTSKFLMLLIRSYVSG